MTNAIPRLGHLHGKSRTELTEWLERALRGRVSLSRLTPDEPADIALSRDVPELDSNTRQGLEGAAMELLARFVQSGDADDEDYVRALLGLLYKLERRDATTPLGTLAMSEAFDARSVGQQAAILGFLLDFHTPLDLAFWRKRARSGRQEALAVTALLRAEGERGLDILPDLRDDDRLATVVHVVLARHFRSLGPKEQVRMIAALQDLQSQCRKTVAKMLGEWLVKYASTASPSSSPSPALERAIDEIFRRNRATTYSPAPQSARLATAA